MFIGDGHNILFWQDAWIEDLGPLFHYATKHIPEADRSLEAKDFFASEYGIWLWYKFQELLPHSICLLIVGCPPPHHHGGADEVVWNGTSSGACTIRSAYERINMQVNTQRSC